jgi:branched-chain amino acid transport system ATP-binding protein
MIKDNQKTILKTNNLVKKFGSFAALDGISLEITSRETRALIGPNGAGKTTFINAISGFIKPTGGSIIYLDEDITKTPPHCICRKGIARTFQLTNVMLGLTVKENVWLGVNTHAKHPWNPYVMVSSLYPALEEVEMICETVGLENKINNIASTMSHGDQRLLEVAIALALKGELLLLDEPTQGVAPGEIDNIIKVIEDVSKIRTVLMIEHNMDVVMDVSDWVTVLVHGKVIAEDYPKNIITNKKVCEVYLGA